MQRTILSFAMTAIFLSAIVFAQADSQAPQWSDQSGPNSTAPGANIVLKASWTDNIALDWAVLSVTWPNGTKDEQSVELSGLEDISGFSYVVPSLSLGSKFKWSITANDTRNNKNTTDVLDFVLKDVAPPTYKNLTQSRDSLQMGDTVLLSAHLSDDFGLSKATFYTNETGTFKKRREYVLSGTESDVSFLWVNESMRLGAVVGWYIEFSDKSGNIVKTPDKSFALRACPVCPSDTPWSDCSAGLQTKTVYTCGADTNYACKENKLNQTCTITIKRSEADSALSAAESAIDDAAVGNKDTTIADKLLEDANAAYNKGDFANAVELAGQAKEAAEKAEAKGVPGKKEVPSQQGADVLPYLIILIAIGIVFFYLYKTGRLHLPVSKKVEDEIAENTEEFGEELAEETAKEAKSEAKGSTTCSVCGKTFDTLYDCEECGTKVCYNDARTYKGKVYCLNDLRKKGLI